MARPPATFKQADLTRAIKAAQSCGLPVVRSEIMKDGRIVLLHQNDAPLVPTNPLDEWKERHNARSA